MIRRSSEEMELLKVDMVAAMHYWTDRIRCIKRNLDEFSSEDSDDRALKRLKMSEGDGAAKGLKCLLQLLKWDAELHLKKSILSYSRVIEIPEDIDSKERWENIPPEDSEDSEDI